MHRMQLPDATKLTTDLTQCLNHLHAVLLSINHVNMDVMSGNLKISLRLTHIFIVYNAIPTCVLGVGNKNHGYKEKFLEILWGPNIAMSN